MPIPLDEYPLHQAPVSLEHPATSDPNFYDRCYFNGHDRTGDVFLVTGLGIYPNLGVIDAYATVRRGDTQHTVRASDALPMDRMNQRVGPYRIEIIEPLQKLRLVCDGAEHGVAMDLTWTGSFPAVEEAHHVVRRQGRVIIDACRFAQVGTWSGTLAVGGDDIVVDDTTWVGTRDRSWGIRPVGGPEAPNRATAEMDPNFGFWWTYIPLRFDHFALVLIMQEDGGGFRSLNDAVRVRTGDDGQPLIEQLGWPDIDIRYRPGTRIPTGAVVRMADRSGKPITLEIESKSYVVLHAGCGYGTDPDWSHGEWRGRGFVEGATYDMNDPDIVARTPFGVIDHVARADCDGQEGWGLFEHGSIGRHAPSGFDDFGSVAP
ncbi:MAG TPA: hypothetical protein VGZ52_10635 [Acidimicrobiales bacterium]|jgi:hypothetical protein|nr:hypothetical protein [Acidimicrobiales bacterium]